MFRSFQRHIVASIYTLVQQYKHFSAQGAKWVEQIYVCVMMMVFADWLSRAIVRDSQHENLRNVKMKLNKLYELILNFILFHFNKCHSFFATAYCNICYNL